MAKDHTNENARLTRILHNTTNAQTWAEEWCKVARRLRLEGKEIIDEGWMIGWFANAFMAQEMEDRRRHDQANHARTW